MKARLISPELVILMGLQGAGKSSFAAGFAATHRVLCKDDWPNHKRPRARLLREARAALEAGRSVVADGTHPRRVDRADLLRLAERFAARKIGYFLSSCLTACLERNQQRRGRARVPDVALYATRNVLERPSLDEGFDELFFVRLADGGGFEVADWRDG